MDIRRRIIRVATAPLDAFGTWLNGRLLIVRDEFTALTREMDEKSSRIGS